MNVLIVDDEALIRRSLARAFEARGHEVRCGCDGHEGLAIWHEGHFDIAIVDILMPGLTGPQLLQKISPSSNTCIILMSAYTADYDVKKAQALGADLFLAKPFQNIFEIVEQVENLVKNRREKGENTKGGHK